MKPKSPCLGCEDRVLYCHSNCEKYIEFKEALMKRSNDIYKAKEIDYILDGIERKRKADIALGKMKKRRGKW